MGGVLDTNLLLYAANADAPENEAAVAFLSQAAASTEAWHSERPPKAPPMRWLWTVTSEAESPVARAAQPRTYQ